MKSFEKFYTEKLHPFQNGILKLVKDSDLPFYLTGGTALSRHYFLHRFSDVLDLFVNNDSLYSDYVNRLYKQLKKASGALNFKIDYERIQEGENYTQLILKHIDGFFLKIDLINDVAPHFGGFEENILLGKIDSWQNILSNKITALSRLEIKDLVDLWIIALNRPFNWRNIFNEAKQKDAGVDQVMIYEILKSVPKESFNLIKWAKPYEIDKIINDLHQIANDLLMGRDNSLIIYKGDA